MTNAEKFKEVFRFEINEGVCCVYEDDCKECFLDRYRSKEKMLDCTEGYWQSEYRGTPTIPLSVIEKITETMEVEYASADELADWFSDGDKTEASYYRGKANGIKLVKGIIDKAVKEIKNDKRRSKENN